MKICRLTKVLKPLRIILQNMEQRKTLLNFSRWILLLTRNQVGKRLPYWALVLLLLVMIRSGSYMYTNLEVRHYVSRTSDNFFISSGRMMKKYGSKFASFDTMRILISTMFYIRTILVPVWNCRPRSSSVARSNWFWDYHLIQLLQYIRRVHRKNCFIPSN